MPRITAQDRVNFINAAARSALAGLLAHDGKPADDAARTAMTDDAYAIAKELLKARERANVDAVPGD